MKLLKKVDKSDILIFLGLSMLWYGSFLLSKPWAFIIIGVIFLVLGLIGASKGGDNK